MKLNKPLNLQSTIVINGKSYLVEIIHYYIGLLQGVRKVVVKPQNNIGKCLSFVVWQNNEINRIIEI